MKTVNQNQLKEFYNNIEDVWDNNDFWHPYSKKIINTFLDRLNFFDNSIVLNAGSGGNDYGISCKKMWHIDIADKKIENLENFIVASVEDIPFDDNSFDVIVCTGSVINYCDALKVISEFSRVLRPSGKLILEFESSWGFEYIGKSEYKKSAVITTLEYINEMHNQWLYSPSYIKSLLIEYGFSIVKKRQFHIISGIGSKILSNKNAVRLTKLDSLFRYIPYFRNRANNVIFLCEKS